MSQPLKAFFVVWFIHRAKWCEFLSNDAHQKRPAITWESLMERVNNICELMVWYQRAHHNRRRLYDKSPLAPANVLFFMHNRRCLMFNKCEQEHASMQASRPLHTYWKKTNSWHEMRGGGEGTSTVQLDNETIIARKKANVRQILFQDDSYNYSFSVF